MALAQLEVKVCQCHVKGYANSIICGSIGSVGTPALVRSGGRVDLMCFKTSLSKHLVTMMLKVLMLLCFGTGMTVAV